MEQMPHGKSKRGRFFTGFFQEFRGEEKIVYCRSNFLYKLIIFHTGIGQHIKMYLQRKLTHFPVPPKFLQIPLQFDNILTKYRFL